MIRWTDALSKKHQTRKAARPNKYGAKPCAHDGQGFRSQLERDVYAALKLMERAGEIRDIRREQPISLTPSIKHKLDFTCVSALTNETYGIEAKGATCATWSLKKRLYADVGPFKIEVWKSTGKGQVGCVEVIEPGRYKIVEIGKEQT